MIWRYCPPLSSYLADGLCRNILKCTLRRKGQTNPVYNNPQINKRNKLVGVKKMVLSLDEFDNGNALLTYYVTGSEEFVKLEPAAPQYKKLRNGEFNLLTLRITNQKDNIMVDSLATIVVLHIRLDIFSHN